MRLGAERKAKHRVYKEIFGRKQQQQAALRRVGGNGREGKRVNAKVRTIITHMAGNAYFTLIKSVFFFARFLSETTPALSLFLSLARFLSLLSSSSPFSPLRRISAADDGIGKPAALARERESGFCLLSPGRFNYFSSPASV